LKETEILKIDARGRIVIPRGMRRSLGLKENSFIMLISDPDNNEIKIVPLTFSENQSFIKLKILIPDKAGALGLIANVFGELGLSLVYGQTVVIKKGVDAEWSVISPVPENITVEELTKVLMEKGEAIKVTIEPSLVNNE
jgi:AbrB family looped-hinge helix DNA binding protein